MITLLSRLLIRPDGRDAAGLRKAYGMLCGAVGILLNVLLFSGKLLAGSLAGSVAITADAFNNLSDAGSSAITLLGFHLAGQKADAHHPFGHGRIEYLSGLGVAVLILLMGWELLQSSLSKILHPAPVAASPLVIAILCVSVGVKLYMAFTTGGWDGGWTPPPCGPPPRTPSATAPPPPRCWRPLWRDISPGKWSTAGRDCWWRRSSSGPG